MKFGVRECCDVVFRAKAPMKVGNKIFYKNEPVIYFDTLKTSTLEGAATTVYAQGGRGNARLMSWDGERTVTFTMEDALISPEGLAILTGAGLVHAGDNDHKVYVHSTETIAIDTTEKGVTATCTAGKVAISGIAMKGTPSAKGSVYVMLMDADGNIVAEPFTNTHSGPGAVEISGGKLSIAESEAITGMTSIGATEAVNLDGYKLLVDYYTEHASNAMEINITPDKFGGAFYIEASTLFREYPSQLDLPAEFIIPNGRVQSNFTFTMAGSGDPSTFTFTVDAFPDYTRFNQTEKVLATIQVIGGDSVYEAVRESTQSKHSVVNGIVTDSNNQQDNPAVASYDGGDMDA